MCILSEGEERNGAELPVFGFPLGGVLRGDRLGISELKFEENSFGTCSIFPKSDFNQPNN